MKSTNSAKNREKADLIEKKWTRSIHAFVNQIDLKFISNQLRKAETCQNVFTEFVTLQFHKKNCTANHFCFRWYPFADFSVKSSWEVNWIVMFQTDAVWQCSIDFRSTILKEVEPASDNQVSPWTIGIYVTRLNTHFCCLNSPQ